MSDEMTMATQETERKNLEAIWWAGALIWAGLVFGADSLGMLPQIGQADAWSWVFFGAGLFALFGDVARVVSPDLPDPMAWDYVWAVFLLILGLGGLTSLEIGFPLLLLLVGGVLLGTTLARRS